MVNRVLIGQPSQIKVSRPGFDVLSSSNINTLFDVDSSHFSILERGSLVGSNDSFVYHNFSRSYANVPLVQFLIRDPNDTTIGLSYFGSHFLMSSSGPWARCYVTSNRIELRARANWTGRIWNFIVWDMNI